VIGVGGCTILLLFSFVICDIYLVTGLVWFSAAFSGLYGDVDGLYRYMGFTTGDIMGLG
jgi:hypothetical protein